MHPILLVYFGLAVLVWQLLRTVYVNFTSPVRSIPGPAIARFTRLWYFARVFKGHFHYDNIALHQQYGPIVRVAPNLFSISQPDKAAYGIGSKFPKSDWYEGMKHPSPDRWTLFPDRDIKRHAAARRNFQAMYSMSSLVHYEPYVDTCTDLFSVRLHEFAEQRQTIDMAHWFQCYAFDVIGDITYSQRFGFLDDGLDKNGIIQALQTNLTYSVLVGIYAWLHPYLFKVMQNLPNSGAAGRLKLMGMVEERIRIRAQERQASEKKKTDVEESMPQDFLDKINDAHDENPQKVTAYHIFMMNSSNIIAGSDTTAIALSSILYYLIRTPESLAKLRAEISEADIESDQRVKFAEAQQLPYLQAIMKEAMRMHAAVGLPLWRDVPAEGAEVCGQYFPAGSSVGFNSWVGHYDTDVFGEDTQQFRPERWLEAEKEGGERLQKMEALYSPFGFGSRTCLGKHVSILEMSKLIPQLVRDFDFSLEQPDQEWQTLNHWFVKPVNFKVNISSRR